MRKECSGLGFENSGGFSAILQCLFINFEKKLRAKHEPKYAMNHKEHCATNLQRSGAGPLMAGGSWVQGRAVGWLIPYSDDIKGELPLTLVGDRLPNVA